jgi:hypothetical protein
MPTILKNTFFPAMMFFYRVKLKQQLEKPILKFQDGLFYAFWGHKAVFQLGKTL